MTSASSVVSKATPSPVVTEPIDCFITSRSTADATEEKIGWIKAGAGDRFDEIELEIGAYFTFVGEAAGGMAKGMAGAFGFTEEEMRAHPHGLFGTVDEIVEELERRRERFGIAYVTVGDNVIEEFAPVVKALTGN